MKKYLFWIVSRIAFGLYKAFPIFGDLRAAVGLIQREGKYLVIQRNDGRGLSFPGGIARPFEPESTTLVREVREETGLITEDHELLFAYRTDIDIPCRITVFRIQASGTLCESWEGVPQWVPVSELQARVARSQLPVVERLLALPRAQSGAQIL